MIGLELAAGARPPRLNAEIKKFEAGLVAVEKALRSVKPKAGSAPARGQKKNMLVQLVSDPAIARLNQAYRGKTGPTDVLSFCYAEKGVKTFEHEPYGEVYISYATAARQAREMRHSLADELTVLLVHGVLHVMGYDHERSERARREMQKLESAALNRLLPQKAEGLITR